MPGMSGFGVASRLRTAGSHAAVVFLTVHDEAELITDGQGSAGYKKQLVRVYVARALRAALADESGAGH
jgi:DNA-binding LytR/AlgR family response regulator